jgi:hypothetical protein
MTLLLVTLLVASLLVNVYQKITYSNKARQLEKMKLSVTPTLTAAPERKAISSKRHKLVETFSNMAVDQYNNGNMIKYLGWHYHCTCGTIAPALDNERDDLERYGSIGSEAGAVRAWHNHLVMHAELVDAGDDALIELQNKFDKYKEECFCHEVR